MTQHPSSNWRPVTALIIGNVALALGPWSVRLADVGPVASGFWRLILALPVLAVLARGNGEHLFALPRRMMLTLLATGVVFAADLACWHIGIVHTRLANATLFGNSSSLMLMVGALVWARRMPRRGETAALVAAVTGAGLLLGRSLHVSASTMTGDLFCAAAALFYLSYLMMVRRVRANVGGWTALSYACVSGAAVLLLLAAAMGERLWPGAPSAFMHGGWMPLLTLTLGSQIIGQGLLVYALRHVSTLVVGLALLAQPAVAVVVGWMAFGEVMTVWDGVGAALISSALVLARVGAT